MRAHVNPPPPFNSKSSAGHLTPKEHPNSEGAPDVANRSASLSASLRFSKASSTCDAMPWASQDLPSHFDFLRLERLTFCLLQYFCLACAPSQLQVSANVYADGSFGTAVLAAGQFSPRLWSPKVKLSRLYHAKQPQLDESFGPARQRSHRRHVISPAILLRETLLPGFRALLSSYGTPFTDIAGK